MNTKERSKSEEHSLDFMLAEFETLRSLRSELVSLGESRVNVFLAIVSGGLVGLAFLNRVSGLGIIIPLITGLVLVGMFLMGLITFARTIERTIGLKIYTRGMNRVRRFFVQLDPDLTDYLLLPISDDRPSFKTTGWLPGGGSFISLGSIVAVINSIIASVAVSLVTAVYAELQFELVVASTIITSLIIYLAQHIYMNIRLREAEKRTEVRFPAKA